jgi:hypothetical protein
MVNEIVPYTGQEFIDKDAELVQCAKHGRFDCPECPAMKIDPAWSGRSFMGDVIAMALADAIRRAAFDFMHDMPETNSAWDKYRTKSPGETRNDMADGARYMIAGMLPPAPEFQFDTVIFNDADKSDGWYRKFERKKHTRKGGR